MSGETEKNISGWTVDTLRQHFQRQMADLKILLDERFQAQTKATEVALETTDKAISKVETSIADKFRTVNEFRGTLSDQAATFMPRTETQTEIAQLKKDIQELKDRQNSSAGETKGSQLTKGNFYAALGALATVLAVVVLLANNVIN